MRDPGPVPQASSTVDPAAGLAIVVADQLIPLFHSATVDVPLARQMAISAIDAYQPETRADFVNVARTIAFSMAALALLGQAAGQDMTMKEKLRAFGRANALNRSADQSERTMMQRRRYQQANQPADALVWTDADVETLATPPELTDEAIEAAVAEAMNAYRASRVQPEPAAAPPDDTPAAILTRPPTSAICIDQPPAAISHVNSGSNSAPVAAMTFKDRLMQHSAIQRVPQTNGRLPAG